MFIRHRQRKKIENSSKQNLIPSRAIPLNNVRKHYILIKKSLWWIHSKPLQLTPESRMFLSPAYIPPLQGIFGIAVEGTFGIAALGRESSMHRGNEFVFLKRTTLVSSVLQRSRLPWPVFFIFSYAPTAQSVSMHIFLMLSNENKRRLVQFILDDFSTPLAKA